ncbi:Glutamate-ammonia-ligase adenylyltransferase [Budvicia aquatica]|uniref:Glutamate-ammonia-ligase adenylyltransferase n=1 Tax=Budvicia aquatica TaxID=82979 RepID=A0A484ZG74_9GAMM|nr:Glutamate-ammonia-ligase adenylyltransferase [Budvicia aquatica]
MLVLPPFLDALRIKRQTQLASLSDTTIAFSPQDGIALALSDFVSDSLLQHPDWWEELHTNVPSVGDAIHYAEWLHNALADITDEAALMRVLRDFRRRMMVRISWPKA